MQEAQLMEVRVFRDDRELVISGVVPDRGIVRPSQSQISDVDRFREYI